MEDNHVYALADHSAHQSHIEDKQNSNNNKLKLSETGPVCYLVVVCHRRQNHVVICEAAKTR